MTEKRFQIIHLGNPYDFVVKDHATNKTYGTLQGDDKSLTELLNELDEENQYLQTRIQMLEGVMNTQHYYQKIADNRTDEVFQIRQIIKEAYENERTQIGKNVLKQLIEQIEE